MPDEFSSPREIAHLNIEHFIRLLQTPLDEATRKMVEQLLVEEKAKLEQLTVTKFPDPPDLGTQGG